MIKHEILNGSQRFIHSDDDSDKSFNQKQSVGQFKEAFAKSSENYFNTIEPKFPDKNERNKQFKKSLEMARQTIQKSRDKEVEKATLDIDWNYRDKFENLDNQIKKYDSIMFLKEKFGLEVKKKRTPKPKPSASSSESISPETSCP